jgi:hypothetical protein
VAVFLGIGGAVALAGDPPLAPKNISIAALGPGAAVSYDSARWEDARDYEGQGLTLMRAAYVRGPARMRVVPGTYVDAIEGNTVMVSWEPAVRGWRFLAVVGHFVAYFSNTTTTIPEGMSITLTSGGDLYTAPSGYAPHVVELNGPPEVSGFEIQVELDK